MLGHSTRFDGCRSGSNGRMKGKLRQLIKMRVRRLFAEESACKIEHSSSSSDGGRAQSEMTSVCSAKGVEKLIPGKSLRAAQLSKYAETPIWSPELYEPLRRAAEVKVYRGDVRGVAELGGSCLKVV